MQPLTIKMGKDEPVIYANNKTGEINLEGRILTQFETLIKRYLDPFSKWFKELVASNLSKTITVNLRFSYFNTNAEKVFIYPVFQLLEEYQSRFSHVKVNWFYQTDDDMMLDTGEIFQSITELDFSFIPVEKV